MANPGPMPTRKSPATRPVAIELFAGAGGMSLGFEQAGFDVLAAAEYDPIHAAIHSYNFPQTEVVCADLSQVSGAQLRDAAGRGEQAHGRAKAWGGEVDVVIGGPPCQGFSTIGKRATDDVRNWLVFVFARLIGELKPRYFVMENVPGMALALADDGKQKLLDVLADVFAEYGYRVTEPTLINASSWGVPQERKRLIVLGAREDQPLIACPIKPADRQAADNIASPSVWDAIGDLPDLNDFEELLSGDEVTLTQRELGRMQKAMSPYARVLHGLADDPADFSWRRRWQPRILTSSYRTTHRPDVVARFRRTEPGRAEPTSRLIRLHPDNPSTTLRAGTHYERGAFNAPRPVHPKLPRVISVREAARLHSFPDWFRLHWTKWHGFRQIGNSLPPLMGRAVGAEIMRALDRTPSRPEGELELGDPALLTMENRAAAAHFNADLTRIPRNELRTRRPPQSVKGRLAVA